MASCAAELDYTRISIPDRRLNLSGLTAISTQYLNEHPAEFYRFHRVLTAADEALNHDAVRTRAGVMRWLDRAVRSEGYDDRMPVYVFLRAVYLNGWERSWFAWIDLSEREYLYDLVSAVMGGMHLCTTCSTSHDVAETASPQEVPAKSGDRLGLQPGAIAVGVAHACRLQPDGAVACWGDNRFGQLGADGTEGSGVPSAVAGVGSASRLAAGDWHTCAIVTDGRVACWGKNDLMQLGVAKVRWSARPVQVAIAPAVDLAAARGHTCALLVDGSVWCWGGNKDDQLGVQAPPRQTISAPVRVPGIEHAVSIAAGSEHSCAAVSDGRLFCWGDNHYGQLGTGIQRHNSFPPQEVPLRGEVLQVVAGARHTCARLPDGTVQCWGENIEGQVGNGGTAPVLTPAQVTAVDSDGTDRVMTHVGWLSAGRSHTCALSMTREVLCWGSNASGQLGQVASERALQAVPSGLANVRALATGAHQTCAIGADDHTSCVGTAR